LRKNLTEFLDVKRDLIVGILVIKKVEIQVELVYFLAIYYYVGPLAQISLKIGTFSTGKYSGS